MVRKEVLKFKKDGFAGRETGTLGAITGRRVTWALTHRPSLIGRELAESDVDDE